MFNGNSLGVNNNNLNITNFQASNQGFYSVVVSNPLGTVTSSNALLLLNAPLRISEPSWSNGIFQLQLVGVAGSNYMLETSSDLINWAPLFTNDASNGFLFLSDTNAGSMGQRFYRGTAD
jgi:hypothetical protein